MPKWNLVTPFLDESPSFALGVQFGMLYARLQKKPRVIKEMVSRKLEDQILLTAGHLGYEVTKRKRIDRCWMSITLKRKQG